jgi:hypothetical protein
VGLKLIETHQLVVCADDKLLGERIHIMKQSTEVVLDASKDVGFEVHRESVYSYIVTILQWNITAQIHVASRSFENVAEFRRL